MTLSIGATAPNWELRDQYGQQVSLRELLLRRVVLVVFVPLAFSAVCTDEVTQLNQWHDVAASAGVEIVVISVDSTATLRAWSETEHLQLPLLSDFWPHGRVATQFDAFLNDKGFANRASFLISQQGIVLEVITSPLGEPRQFGDYEQAISALQSKRE